MLLEEESPAYEDGSMDLRYELIRLACDNRTSAQPFSRFGIFPVFSGAGAKVNGRPSFMAIRERQLWSCRFTPFVESVRWNQARRFLKACRRKEGALSTVSARALMVR
jgi:hypothetical protein